MISCTLFKLIRRIKSLNANLNFPALCVLCQLLRRKSNKIQKIEKLVNLDIELKIEIVELYVNAIFFIIPLSFHYITLHSFIKCYCDATKVLDGKFFEWQKKSIFS